MTTPPATRRDPARRAPAGGAGASPEAHAAARRIAQNCVEIISGFRPTSHARPLTAASAWPTVLAQLTRGHERMRQLPHPSARAVRATTTTAVGRCTAGPLWVCEALPGIAEAAIVVRTAGRSWALALRLERRDGTWWCTGVWPV